MTMFVSFASKTWREECHHHHQHFSHPLPRPPRHTSRASLSATNRHREASTHGRMTTRSTARPPPSVAVIAVVLSAKTFPRPADHVEEASDGRVAYDDAGESSLGERVASVTLKKLHDGEIIAVIRPGV
ncbi:hypothetical protein HBH56_123120 [Parastagonospora nodorum]|uniref:Uncharacterized protein n=1 Tax=Phaeosphaeria nodorum (strain SN15 / ATCC MYA-4574 / FGSC 10173) TaxID=321614 RepID=A0A7U2HUT3_PHANO|nr:hypothetical protein HBH56_123120 [Parastagonospora nodorum]QRC91109.1 hypothetical protein JI435_426480 [Parastagonospora nodorum SN15]KAH3935085.1 hypothetical protein HBH54_048660 [Parastagonospora nodorum]KAH3950306.1 hypothetical protein HBH53_080640 [Parastagonospora nodorum]KAH3982727.1 hypothetical protein HBH51_038540 [Parastagonospora nodorum]